MSRQGPRRTDRLQVYPPLRAWCTIAAPVNASLDPIALFQDWFEAAHHVGLPEPAAMAMASVAADGQPSVRMVLLRGLDERGFVFFTNLNSRKAHELLRPGSRASLCFYWPPLTRQVRVEGTAERVDDAEADAYWATRPRGHQVAAYASPQSEPLRGGEQELAARFAEFEAKLPATHVPRPAYWSGFRVIPTAIEFWEGRENRLHRRVLYVKTEGGWTETTLAP